MIVTAQDKVRPWLLFIGFGLLLYLAGAAARPGAKSLPALDAAEAAAVCSASGYPPADFWQRAQAMGVGAMALRADTLGELIEGGRVLVFSRAELEKWKSAGLIAPNAALKPNALWVRDAGLFARLSGVLAAQGLLASTGTAAGHGFLELKGGLAPETFAGSSAEDAASAAAVQMIPFVVGPAGAVRAGRSEAAPLRVLENPVRLAALLRSAYAQRGRVLLLGLDPAGGVEGNLDRLRALLRPLRDRELIGREWPEAAVPSAAASPGRWRLALAWLLAVLGPIIAVRLGVKAFKRVRVLIRKRSPLASPVAELLMGVASTAAAAVAAGLAVALLLKGSNASQLPEGIAFSTLAWPLVIGGLALFPLSRAELTRRLSQTPTYADLLRLAGAAAAAAILFRPRPLLAAAGLGGWAQSVADGSALIWWWTWRWREFLIGLPAFMNALLLAGRQFDAEVPEARRSHAADPRPWLWLGLFFPIGAIAALGRPGAAPFMVLGHSVVVVLAGGALGGAWLALRALWEARGRGEGPIGGVDREG